jgi:NADH-quinone oxidoreductase subunit L
VGALAIAGVPLLSGFFSKDEILYRTYMSGHHTLWLLGVMTSLLTAVYMFRLVFLAFHGERRAPGAHAVQPPAHPEEEEPAAQASPANAHGHGPAHLHDAPPSMAVPLIVLAIGSVLAGYAGVPQVLRGANRIERFLEPSFEAAAEPAAGTAPAGAQEHATAPEGPELELMGVSVAAALVGIGLAVYFFLKRRDAAAALTRRFSRAHRMLLGKYYVDEIYDTLLVQPIKVISSALLWRGIDAGFIDGAVNGTGTIVRGWSGMLRRLQTGSVRAYAASLFVGVVLILAYYLWA